jgi:hypothetical protein
MHKITQCTRFRAAVFLGAFALTCPAMVTAQARGPQAWESPDMTEDEAEATHAEELQNVNAWLRKLPGRYISTSALNAERPGIVIDCIGVGTGPGVQCMTGRGGNTERGEAANASMSLYGLDPLALVISRMSVNGRGIAEEFSSGKLKGDTLVFQWIDCWIPENERMKREMNVDRQILLCKQRLKIRQWEKYNEVLYTLDQRMLIQITTRSPKGATTNTGWVDSGSTNIMRRVSQEEEPGVSR